MRNLDIDESHKVSGMYTRLCVVVSIIFAAIIFLAVGIGVGYVAGKNKFEERCPVVNGNNNNTNNGNNNNTNNGNNNNTNNGNNNTNNGNNNNTNNGGTSSKQNGDEEQEKSFKEILMEMKAANIRNNSKVFTSLPHPPGLERNKILGEMLMDEWTKNGMDSVENFKYNIYLSYPESPGEITLHGGAENNGDENFVIHNEPTVDESEKNNDKILYPFHAFSGRGNVTGEIIYGNYGTTSDFNKLKELGIDVTGKIMLFRYGKTSRTRKIYRTEIRGGLGCIVFSDPYDHTIKGQEYPNGWMLNQDGIERGTVNRLPGDALSIGYPSKDNYWRKNEKEYSGNPKIPSQPISYLTAYKILKYMANSNEANNNAPDGFSGALNFTKYPLRSGERRNVTLKVFTYLETKASYTQCAKLYGKTEPDRYIMIGNHRDAWTYGASDPSSGTAVMMEIVRALGEYKKKGWRPRRSIMACSWGAEEAGILGSTEWADENHKFLTNHVAAYLNVDMAVEGNFTVRLKTLDYLVDAIYKAAKIIPAPNVSDTNLYDDWHTKSMMLKKTDNKTVVPKPTYKTATSGSDYKPMWHTYGTPIADFRYYFSKLDFPKLSQNGHYHTAYESFGWMDKFVDQGFTHHLAIGRLWAGHALYLADSKILPMNLEQFTNQVMFYLIKFEKRYKTILDGQNISLDFAKERLTALIDKSVKFHKYVNKVKETEDQNLLRAINDKLMNFERNFIMKGLAANEATRHVIYATSTSTMYTEKFPGVGEAITRAYKNRSSWDDVRKQITYVVWCFDTANRSLDVEEIKE